ncbi:hypothetical protein ERO13_A07G045300v2 [Gossypium hirsutum]|uniref:Cell division cycle 20.2, cofactor of APC complex isoform X1 n=2 Tax=Gossypium hirsutum TaxID=3635 RepID=A0A1U8MI35_GOSHI|nr:cell division cycle 20.2, cofactor of APC complex-like isoform X1 [Gossypium hirsutum]KAG4190674.1 hypothetical protein ERO13_A07G045300v2 [Gossypium hirsutum]
MDQSDKLRLLQSYWYSPRRLHDSPTRYHFPGDRFLPNRSLMDLDRAHTLLTNKTTDFKSSKCDEVYQQKLIESQSLNSEGKRIMVFKGSSKSSTKSIRFVDELRQEMATISDNKSKQAPYRSIPKAEMIVLDAPGLLDDYYVNIMSWGKNNVLAVGLGPTLYLWNSVDQRIHKLFHVREEDNWPTSITWSEEARTLAVGYTCSNLQLWDAESSKLIRSLQGHSERITSTAWNGHILTSGSRDKSIINHDIRARNHLASSIKKHSDEVCGLKWSNEGDRLASGGSEKQLYIWEASKMSSSKFLHLFTDHCAAVKALAWCPYQHNVLASGGGWNDRCIRIWNTQKGICIHSIETKAQISGLEWNRHHKEILSSHGYSTGEDQNKLCLWKYPSMTKVGEFGNHEPRIINLCQSPDGVTVVSAVADETLRFWDVFGPPMTGTSMASDLQGLFSSRNSLIR